MKTNTPTTHLNPLAGTTPTTQSLIDVPKLIAAYYTEKPDVNIPEQRVSFGTSGHRGSSLKHSFNETHILATTQAICDYRKQHQINGPLFLGMDTHALSAPAHATALEVLAANNVTVFISKDGEFTPTPAISLAILNFNRKHKLTKSPLADGIVITPSHNPPSEGGFKYNPPNGGPADQSVTAWIQIKANEYIQNHLAGIKRTPIEKALKVTSTQFHDYVDEYVNDLINVIDLESIKNSKIKLGVDPLGGAGVHYWKRIADQYGLDLTVVNDLVDPTFRFMTIDWDGQIRMDPSSPYAMRRLVDLKDKFDVAFACDTDHDRHGIVAKSCGLLPSNHYLAVSIDYLFKHRPQWKPVESVGKTVVSSRMIDLVTAGLNRKLYEVPAGFKWFVDGLYDGTLGFVGEESAGGTFLRKDGAVWTTDKDGIIMALLAAEITCKTKKDPGIYYQELTEHFGKSYYERVDAPATPAQKAKLSKISSEQITSTTLAGERITSIITKAPGNDAPIGGIKVSTEHGWFAVRPSGTENIYKIYAESFKSQEHLNQIIEQAQQVVDL